MRRPGSLFWPTLALAALLLAPLPVAAESPAAEGQLEEVERAIEKRRQEDASQRQRAANLKQEAESLRRQSVGLARTIHGHEARMTELESKLAGLAGEEAEKRKRLEQRRRQSAQVLTVLERLARYPPEALLVQPLPPGDMVRSAILLRAAVPEIERRAARLRQDLAELAAMRQRMALGRQQLAAAAGNLEEERKRLEKLVERKNGLRRDALAKSRQAARRVQALSRKARSLRDLLAALEEQRRERQALERKKQLEEAAQAHAKAAAQAHAPPPPPPPPAPPAAGPPISKARGRLAFPAIGRVTGRYGQATDTGMTRRGIVIETRAAAQVISPYDGRVVFAGPFRGYGQLLIIEHGEGYHSLVAGMARIDTVIGQWVLAGEPIGVMGPPGSRKPALYVELRREGQPINPLPWLAARKGKVSG